jgi:hypothetical protein
MRPVRARSDNDDEKVATTMAVWKVRWARIGAMLLLAAICVDVASVHCDGPLIVGSSEQGLAAVDSPSNTGDPCAATCVPDCFCCSTTDDPLPIDLCPQPGPPAPYAIDDVPSPAAGIQPLPYHPPLNLL